MWAKEEAFRRLKARQPCVAWARNPVEVDAEAAELLKPSCQGTASTGRRSGTEERAPVRPGLKAVIINCCQPDTLWGQDIPPPPSEGHLVAQELEG